MQKNVMVGPASYSTGLHQTLNQIHQKFQIANTQKINLRHNTSPLISVLTTKRCNCLTIEMIEFLSLALIE